MRQLFLPACLCFVTWSGATNSDNRFTLDEFMTPQAARHGIAVLAKGDDSRTDVLPEHSGDISGDTRPAGFHRPSDEEIAAALNDLAIEHGQDLPDQSLDHGIALVGLLHRDHAVERNSLPDTGRRAQ